MNVLNYFRNPRLIAHRFVPRLNMAKSSKNVSTLFLNAHLWHQHGHLVVYSIHLLSTEKMYLPCSWTHTCSINTATSSSIPFIYCPLRKCIYLVLERTLVASTRPPRRLFHAFTVHWENEFSLHISITNAQLWPLVLLCLIFKKTIIDHNHQSSMLPSYWHHTPGSCWAASAMVAADRQLSDDSNRVSHLQIFTHVKEKYSSVRLSDCLYFAPGTYCSKICIPLEWITV